MLVPSSTHASLQRDSNCDTIFKSYVNFFVSCDTYTPYVQSFTQNNVNIKFKSKKYVTI